VNSKSLTFKACIKASTFDNTTFVVFHCWLRMYELKRFNGRVYFIISELDSVEDGHGVAG
jgi:hypothetical protein